ncbi:nucleotide disphospho-sugar-binding domain-containing protein [Rhizobium sp. P44RR-XXIV]|uniref:glycosyltransferase n=1 Tax=Rhizobium sp. P44RR-XXIV TaxID=1921145 RepID=UPI000986BDCC|nr:nucleotide disphospho-sugar-binding domain-containing protein [Rhizobium sp. P44RR-XXIV]TIX90516.1 UDP-glucuronosyltransferase [Rhizobium sp. P44RR-XXIV]
MSIALFAWELGNNLGHLARDIPVALALRARGHVVHFASRNLSQARKLLEPLGFVCVQAPCLMRAGQSFAPNCYAEILLATGYGDDLTAKALVTAWQRLFEAMKVDIVISNHAPGAVLASRCSKIPVVATCIGFELPPARPEIFRVRGSTSAEQSVAAEQLVCRIINQVLASSGRERIENIAQLFSYASLLMTTFPELDHYGRREGLEYIGLVSHLPSEPANWLQSGRKRIFAYLRNTVPNINAILAGLAASASEVLCIMPDCSSSQIRDYNAPHFRIQRDTIDISSVLQSCDLAVTYGSGTIHAALLAGCPLLMCPQNVEQYMLSLQVVRLGGGLLLPVGVSANAIAETMSILLLDARFPHAAKAFSEKYRGFTPASAVGKIVETIERQL